MCRPNSNMSLPFRCSRVVVLWSLLVVITSLIILPSTSAKRHSGISYGISEASEGDADAGTGSNEAAYDTASGDNEADDGSDVDDDETFQDDDEEQTAKLGLHGYPQEPQLNDYQPQNQQPQSYQPAPVYAPPTSSSNQKQKKKKVYVPVFVPDKEKKKMKIITVEKGFFIQGGTQLFGKFKSLKHCMKACAVTPACLAGDYNPWLHKCYQHTNFTACNTLQAHPQYVHFSKVPCTVVDAPTGRVTLGASMANGIEQKGIDNLQQCIKKCVSAGSGVAAAVMNDVKPVTVSDAFIRQGCFAIDYDFSTHKCFFFENNLVVTFSTPLANPGVITLIMIFLHCPIKASQLPSSLGTRPNPNVVHITFCPIPQNFVTV